MILIDLYKYIVNEIEIKIHLIIHFKTLDHRSSERNILVYPVGYILYILIFGIAVDNNT